MEILNNASIQEEGEDNRVWVASQDGLFSKSAGSNMISPLFNLWKLKAPGVIAFSWLALQTRILTMDNLRRQKIIMVNACPMCLVEEETVDHLLMSCRVVHVMVTYSSLF